MADQVWLCLRRFGLCTAVVPRGPQSVCMQQPCLLRHIYATMPAKGLARKELPHKLPAACMSGDPLYNQARVYTLACADRHTATPLYPGGITMVYCPCELTRQPTCVLVCASCCGSHKADRRAAAGVLWLHPHREHSKICADLLKHESNTSDALRGVSKAAPKCSLPTQYRIQCSARSP